MMCNPKFFNNKNRGFTLIELMITVVVIGVLAAVAYPSYNQWVLKARRAEAKAAIMQALQQQERFYTTNNAYAVYSSAQANGLGFKAFSGDNPTDSYWNMTATPCPAPNAALNLCIQVVATLARTADADCASLTADSMGNKTSTGITANNAVCWR